MSDETITYGKFVTKKTTRPATVVDCSGWADPADGPVIFGQFVTKKKTRPAIVSKLHVSASLHGGELFAIDAEGSDAELFLRGTSISGGVIPSEVFAGHCRRVALALADVRAAVPMGYVLQPEVRSAPTNTSSDIQRLVLIRLEGPDDSKRDELVIQSAFALLEDQMAEAEVRFQDREASITAAGGVIPEQEQKIAAALDRLKDTIEAAVAAGIRVHLIRDE